MTSYIQSIQCFGPVSFFAQYRKADKVWIEMHENYQKRSWRNRFRILSSCGPEIWSIPLVKGKNERQPIREVRIAYDEAWISRHLHAIRSAYGKSPYFEDIFPDLINIFEKKYRFLWDLDMESLAWSIGKMSLSSDKIEMSSEYRKNYIETVDFRNVEYVSEIKKTTVYNQVWEEKFGFVEDLSILDLLFCTGPEAVYYL